MSGPETPGPAQQQILDATAHSILARRGDGRQRVAVDGVDGAGKTTFARHLVETLRAAGT